MGFVIDDPLMSQRSHRDEYYTWYNLKDKKECCGKHGYVYLNNRCDDMYEIAPALQSRMNTTHGVIEIEK